MHIWSHAICTQFHEAAAPVQETVWMNYKHTRYSTHTSHVNSHILQGMVHYGLWSFAVVGLSTWNSYWHCCTTDHSLTLLSFRHQVKTYLFGSAHALLVCLFYFTVRAGEHNYTAHNIMLM